MPADYGGPLYFQVSNDLPNDMEGFWALSWLEHNANYLTVPGSIATGAADNLLSPGNVSLINEISDRYADYKSEKITKAQKSTGSIPKKHRVDRKTSVR